MSRKSDLMTTFDGSVLHAVVDLSHNPRLKTFYKLKESEILKKELTSDGLRLG